MSDLKFFFEAITKHYERNLPFVVYSRPINSIIKCWLQEDDTLHHTSDFKDSGFVFAPFDLAQSSVLFPEYLSQHYTVEAHELEVSSKMSTYDLPSRTNLKQQHLDLVSQGIKAIKDKRLEKVVLSRVEIHELGLNSPIDTFKQLFNRYKNAMVYCWYHPKIGLWLGATPELLFKVIDRQLTAISLAGTKPFDSNGSPQWTIKELQEQKIVTDYLASQVAPFTEHTKLSEVETIRAGNLWHLKTRLISQLKPDTDLGLVIEALHPTPAVCGFPKDNAKRFILDNEGYDREYYTGFLGELNLKHTVTRNKNRNNVENNAYGVVKTYSNFYVNLRCMQLKDTTAQIYVGGGITGDSEPLKEWDETCNKAKTICNVLRK